MSNDLPNYDKIIKELQIIETIFHSQMNPDFHLGSGIGFPRYCNEIFIVSDVALLKINDYKREYTSRLEQPNNNTSLVINELKAIYNKSVELYNFYVHNLYYHPDKKAFFVGNDGGQQIIDSTGYYYFMNYTVRFGFFGVEQDSEFMNNIHSTYFKNSFRYNCKNETLINFCVQLLEFIKLSEVLVEEVNKVETKKTKIQKTLFEFIHNVNDKDLFLADLKRTFPTEIGKSMKAIIDILTKEQIIIYGTKEFKQLYTVIKMFFNRDIGTYNGIQNIKTVDKDTTEIVYKKLNFLIIKHKTI